MKNSKNNNKKRVVNVSESFDHAKARIEKNKEIKIMYSEPSNYFPEETRRIFGLGEYYNNSKDEEKIRDPRLLRFVKDKNYYIYDTGCYALLDIIGLNEIDAIVLDGPCQCLCSIRLINEFKREYEVSITKAQYDKLYYMGDDAFLRNASKIINVKKYKDNRSQIKLSFGKGNY